MIVCKFGGTSVGDAPAIGRLVEIVQARVPEQPLVVVSALSGVTDALLALPGLPEDLRGTTVRRMMDRHLEVAAALGLRDVEPALREEAAALEQTLAAVAPGAATPEALDRVSGTGERWSSRLVVAALAAAGVEAVWVDARPVVRTDDRFTRASPERAGLSARAAHAFRPPLAAGRVPVTQGFLGSTADGRPTTLGRGGSDFTATLLGAALGADRVEIWTDVDGIMTADPRLVPEALVLPVASHLEAAELAAFGAKVLHPATQAPLVEAGVPCVVLNSFAPDRPGTTIVAGLHPTAEWASPVRAISWKPGVTVLNIRSGKMLGASGFVLRVFEVFDHHGVSVDVLATSEVNISLTVEEPAPVTALCHDLEAFGDVTVYPSRAIVAVIGIDLRGTRGLAARIFRAVQHINVEVISQGASEINVTFVVREEDGAEAVRALHREFFGNGAHG